MISSIFYLYFVFSFIFVKSKDIITIPFYNIKNITTNYMESSSKKYFIDELIYSTLHSIIKIGEPEKEINVFISNQNYYIFLTSENQTDIKSNNNYYKFENSRTFENLSSSGKLYIKSKNDIRIKEKIKLNILNYENNETREIQIDDLNIILPEENKNKNKTKHKIYNLNIGLNTIYIHKNNNDNYNYTFLYQLQKLNIINNYYFSLIFKKGRNKNGQNLYNTDALINTNAELIIGDFPHKYKPYLLDEAQLITIKSKYLFWTLYFTNVYYYINENDEKQIINNLNSEIIFSDFLITAPINYFTYINKHYFQNYFLENICKTDYSGDLLFIFCFANNFTFDDLQKFPTLYFQHDELNFTFELTYEDLFIEKDNKYWFLIVFESFYEINKWLLGNIFLRKYYFVFNQESRTIGFYNLNIKTIKETNDEKNPTFEYYYIIILFGCILSAFVGFIIAKFIYKKVSKKIKASELKDKIYEINDNEII